MKCIIIASVVVVSLAIFAWIWFSASGGGAYSDSPDGKYRISTSNLDRRTLTQGQMEYISIEIVDNSTKKTIWNATRYMNNNEEVTDFRSANNHTHWAANLKSVSVSISNSETLVIPLP